MDNEVYRFLRDSQQACRSIDHKINEVLLNLKSLSSNLLEINNLCDKLIVLQQEQKNE